MNQSKDHFLIVGGGGREASFALELIKDSVVSAFITHQNPTILDCVHSSGGSVLVGDVCDAASIVHFASEVGIDYAFVSADDPLANGVVDALLESGIKTVGATRAASRIEWDKVFSMAVVKEAAPAFTPFFEIIDRAEQIEPALERFVLKAMDVVVKPQGLTGGKGVKVMPEHLRDHKDCANYALKLLNSRPDEQVLFVEKLLGTEFTIMGLTDGCNLVMSPASYDYPFRFENDSGPGTGGMGCFTAADGKLPFLTDADIDQCESIMRCVLESLDKAGTRFNGVLNGGFFKTAKGIRFMEFNSRFGDPEGLNVLSLLDGSLAEVLRTIESETLNVESISFSPAASVTKYLVAAEYPNRSPSPSEFTVNLDGMSRMGLTTYFSAAERVSGNRFTTLGGSRVVAIGGTGQDIASVSDRINQGIKQFVTGDLDYRSDVGSQVDIDRMTESRQ